MSIYVSNSIPHPAEKRAIVQAVVNALGNSASICKPSLSAQLLLG